eukprot:scaffold1503_cov250-Pinguiococcus_pyrenoidosus.AAC.14
MRNVVTLANNALYSLAEEAKAPDSDARRPAPRNSLSRFAQRSSLDVTSGFRFSSASVTVAKTGERDARMSSSTQPHPATPYRRESDLGERCSTSGRLGAWREHKRRAIAKYAALAGEMAVASFRCDCRGDAPGSASGLGKHFPRKEQDGLGPCHAKRPRCGRCG